METKASDDKLGRLILANERAPLPWGKQLELVDLFLDFIDKQGKEHKRHVDELEQLIKLQQDMNEKLTLGIKGCKYVDSPRRSRQGGENHASSKVA